MPPSMVYSPVRTITRTDPIQKLSIVIAPICRRSSGSSVAKTTPPAKMPTAIFETTKVTSDTSDRTYRECVEKRRSRNSGMVNTIDRA